MSLGLSFHVYTCARTTNVATLDRDRLNLTILWNQPSPSSAYARAVENPRDDIVIFAHCDMFFLSVGLNG
jgi:hypothetical protein